MGDDVTNILALVLLSVAVAGFTFFMRGKGADEEVRRDANMVTVLWLVFFVPAVICTSVSFLSALDAGNYENTEGWYFTWVLLGIIYAVATAAATIVTARVFLHKLNIPVAHFALFIGGIAMLMFLSGIFALGSWINVIGFAQ